MTTKAANDSKIVVRNVNVPGYEKRVDRAKYNATRKALLKVLPKKAPGMTQRQMFTAVKKHLPDTLFPGGATSGWWTKTVQLDLEAKRLVGRTIEEKPTRWFLTTRK